MSAVLHHVWHVLPVFLPACITLAVIPGPATALFIQRSLRDGRRAGLSAVAGNELGLYCWALASGLGLTGLLAVNRIAFDGLRILGAVVLVWLGIQAWRSAGQADEFGAGMTRRLPSGRTPGAAFRASLLSMAANPKAAIFAFSFFPQFLPKSGHHVFTATVVLGLVQVVVDSMWCIGVVLLVGRARDLLARVALRKRLERGIGVLLVALGLTLLADTR